ncbi:hypothetical protein SAMN05192558_10786 [Actinokineospora alba]|uniref:Uncharacterized protein n=1 Tax=Actinokineospora alba TaxID=504798 RepID=A0A1H0QPA0_9PSEU|nr:hypothetical protein C8E96_6065 [Actinokineospora alba]SDI31241.1 hypothetical protein SAMN05421871_10485 [Actinokineospora alba]SDP19203.1 hypothetical protein SAMN05192558_10786 [Actinokineospora alba]
MDGDAVTTFESDDADETFEVEPDTENAGPGLSPGPDPAHRGAFEVCRTAIGILG